MFVNIPEELKSNKSWIRYAMIDQERKKKSKIPYYGTCLKWAKVNNAETWTDFNTVVDSMDKIYKLPVWMKIKHGKWDFKDISYIRYEYKKFDGIGYVFSDNCLYVGIDYDNWYDKNGEINSKSKEILNICNQSYTEISQSKTGGHTIVKLNSAEDKKHLSEELIKRYGNNTGCRNDDIGIECYFTGRYFAMTGDVVEKHTEIKTIDVNTLLDLFTGIKKEKRKQTQITNPKASIYLDDNKIIEMASKAKNGRKFIALYNEAGKPGNSENDFAFASMLAFYTQDKDQIKRIMINSPRYRAKFADSNESYLNITVNNAINSKKDTYNPNYRSNEKKCQQPVDKSVDNIESILESINDFKGNISREKEIKQEIKFTDSCFISKNWGSGYYLTLENGFCKRWIKGNEYFDKIITPIVLIPKKLVEMNGKEELMFNSYNGSRWREFISNNELFSNVRQFKIFIRDIFKFSSWFDGDINDITRYDKYISTLIKKLKLPVIKAIDKLGWTKDGNFNPYNDSEFFIKDNLELKKIENSFKSKGNYKKWKEDTEHYLKNDFFRAAFNTSLSSVLASKFKRPTFWTNIVAEKDTGKTPALYGAASIFADPFTYVPAFDTTKIGLEFRLNSLGNLPNILDDSQCLNEQTQKYISELIYMVANGSGKNRGNLKGQIQDSKSWSLCMLTNGEKTILNGNEYEGAIKRIMEFHGKPFEFEFEAKNARKLYLNNYGFFGSEFIKFIQDHYEEIEKLFYKFETNLDNDINISNHILNFSTMCVSDYIFKTQCLQKNNHKQIFENIISWGKRMLRKLPKNQDIDKNQIGLVNLKEYVNSNKALFEDNYSGRVGFYDDDKIYFFKNKFKNILNEWSVPEKRFLKFIKDNKYCEIDKNGQFVAITRKETGHRTQRLIVFNRDILEEV
ncbi:MAG: DUF927 domain-containing protein [Promethearchaeota archaeon]